MTTHALKTLSFALVAIAAVTFPRVSEARDARRHGTEVRVSTAPPRPMERANGHYELVTTEVWVPGSTERVWVENCRPRGKAHGHRKHRRCDGHYETVTRSGYYEERHEWVWRPAPSRPRIVFRTPVGIDIRVTL